MGKNTAIDLAESVALNEVKLRVAMEHHLRYNHFPPVPLSMVDICIEAIDNADNGDWDKLVTLPDRITWKDKPSAPSSDIIEFYHLEWFLEEDEFIDILPNEEEERKEGWV